MSDVSEREDLESLIKSPGWKRVLGYARSTWAGDGYAQRIKLAIREATEKGWNVAEAVQRVDAANDEVNALLSWPQARTQALLKHENINKEIPVSRRGGL